MHHRLNSPPIDRLIRYVPGLVLGAFLSRVIGEWFGLPNLVAAAEYTNLLSNAAFMSFLVRNLLQGNPNLDSDGAQMMSDLASGTSRFDVFCATLNGARFKALCPDDDFVDMLYGGTLQRTNVDHNASECQLAGSQRGFGMPRPRPDR